MSKLPRKQIFDLVGENQLNSDGSYRQKILQRCLPGARVEIFREPENQYDKDAIYVVLSEAKQGIGYIARADTALLAAALDAGISIKGRIHELTGGLEDYENFGCRICIVASDKDFRNVLPLKPEQIHYEHAPRWREPKVKSHTPKASTQKAKSGLLSAIFSGLFKK